MVTHFASCATTSVPCQQNKITSAAMHSVFLKRSLCVCSCVRGGGRDVKASPSFQSRTHEAACQCHSSWGPESGSSPGSSVNQHLSVILRLFCSINKQIAQLTAESTLSVMNDCSPNVHLSNDTEGKQNLNKMLYI